MKSKIIKKVMKKPSPKIEVIVPIGKQSLHTQEAPKKLSPRSPKFHDSEYVSELDRDFGFDINQDPLTEDL